MTAIATRPSVLWSPLNGGTFEVPPGWTSEFIDELLARGFKRVDEPSAKGKDDKSKAKTQAA